MFTRSTSMMQDNEFQRPLSRSQFQLTCGRENMVDLGRRNDDKSRRWFPSISACFRCMKKLFLQTSVCHSPLNYSANIIHCFPDKGRLNESLERKSTWSPYSLICESSVCACNVHVTKSQTCCHYIRGPYYCPPLSFLWLCYIESALPPKPFFFWAVQNRDKGKWNTEIPVRPSVSAGPQLVGFLHCTSMPPLGRAGRSISEQKKQLFLPS